jgi:mannose-6-phosphate isomerase-like protein (cupin superfamily)
MTHLTRRQDAKPYQTRDGSEIRELMHPALHGNRQQSLAEAIIRVEQKTHLHYHQLSEELYHVIYGTGRITLGEDQFSLRPGDTVCIPPGTVHCIENIGHEDLHILCICVPAYSHNDTVVIDGK